MALQSIYQGQRNSRLANRLGKNGKMSNVMNLGAIGGSAAGGEYIKDGSMASFAVDVIEASKSVPVIVDFWATWCSPCKMLTPSLERVVNEAKGKVRLVKIDVDKNQKLAVEMRIQSVPTVYVFKDGKPVDGFTGAIKESELRELIAQHTGEDDGAAQLAQALEQGKIFLEEGDAETALEIFKEVLAQDNANAVAFGGLLRAMIALGRKDEAKDILSQLPDDILSHAVVAQQKNAITLSEEAGKLGPVSALEAKIKADPDDHQTRLDLAIAKFAAGASEEAIDLLLDLYRRDREWNDAAAKKQLLQFFETLGLADPLTVASRKRLSSLMFS